MEGQRMNTAQRADISYRNAATEIERVHASQCTDILQVWGDINPLPTEIQSVYACEGVHILSTGDHPDLQARSQMGHEIKRWGFVAGRHGIAHGAESLIRSVV
eukprot:CAMPEP_0173219958 /NCGR_PEP_ID=MMETSP1142-20121109/1887_1 /TAXON_ID=483371 /ORGANISM="non described non described, Strain CCMP2298" /LENGTH=102 /DNA_ID=CAMNT_0014147801 /DNA_START=557 /DNA_END=865 /DNA_ORIENTATION=-